MAAGGTGALRRWPGLLLAVALCLGVSGLGALATDAGPGSWYAGLDKAPWNPPAWVFAPVWTALYVAMGVALWCIWRAPAGVARRRAQGLFFLQLALNLAWSWLFFGLEAPAWALADLVILVGAIAATMRAAWPIAPAATWLLAPYLAWCAYAASLNAVVVALN